MTGLPAVPSYTTFVTRIHRDTASDQAWSKEWNLRGHDSPEHRCSAYSLCIKEDDVSETDRQTLKDPS
ncbi:Hypothetical protein FKW44_020813 [Caligus rogercresseyi]|uniref:Uncharacterized protein n=1 Tax=Caligus rogercresseyi TaxID=217165 RepID=A0A7T8GQ59_CALRO|nr:Hypothetical protein FKW44_020813 [Caligus rogercresseyi]